MTDSDPVGDCSATLFFHAQNGNKVDCALSTSLVHCTRRSLPYFFVNYIIFHFSTFYALFVDYLEF